MKYTLLVLATLLSVFTVPGTVARPEPNLFGDIWNGTVKSEDHIIDKITNRSQAGVKAITDFFSIMGIATADVAKDATHYAEIIGQNIYDFVAKSIVDFVATVHDFGKNLAQELQHVGNNVKRRVLINVLDALNHLNASTYALQDVFANLSSDASKRVNDQKQHIIGHWSNWTATQVSYVSNETHNDARKVNEAAEITSELLQRYTQYLDICADELTVNMHNFELKVYEEIADCHNAIAELISEVQDCLHSDNSNSSENKCARNIRRKLQQLAKRRSDFAVLTKQALKFAALGLDGNRCVLQTLEQFELEQYNVKRRLNEIVANESNFDNANTANQHSNNTNNSGADNDDDDANNNTNDASAGSFNNKLRHPSNDESDHQINISSPNY